MPNDLNRNNHLIDADNDKSSRKKLASSGFTASVWTLSGVVLAACGSLDNLFSDGGGGGARGNSVSVNASPVQQARVYFDMDGDGSVGANDIALQDQQYPDGFITDSRGLAHGIPEELYGRPFMAILDGAFDSDTGQKLDGEYRSVPGEDGRHSIASPITDLIVQVENSPGEDVEDVLTRILNDEGGGSYSPKEIQEIAEALLIPENYLDASGRPVVQVVQGLAKYLADNKAKQEAGQGYDEAEDYTALAKGAVAVVDAVEEAMLSPNPVVILNEDMDEDEPEVQVEFAMGEHDSYVGIINAISTNGAPVRFEIVGDAAENDDKPPYSINARGVINVNEDRRAEIEPGITNLQVRVSAGNDHAPTYVDVKIDVKEAPQIQLHDIRDYGFGEVTPVGLINENNRPDDGVVIFGEKDVTGDVVRGAVWISTTVLEPEWMIRGDFADYFEMVREPDGRFSLALKEGATLDYEAIQGGAVIDIYGRGAERYERVVNLQVAVKDGAPGASGVLSEFIDLQIAVLDTPEAEFSGDFTAYVVEDENVEGGNLVVRGVVNIAERPGGDRFTDTDRFTIWDYERKTEAVEADGIYTMTLDYGTFTYNLASGEWVYSVQNSHDAVQSMNVVDSFSDIFRFEATNYDGTIAERAVYLNVLGANEDVYLTGNGQNHGSAEFIARRGVDFASPFYAYQISLSVLEDDPDGVNADGYTYTWYRHDPGKAPVVVEENHYVPPFDYTGPDVLIEADQYYVLNNWSAEQIERGSYFSVDVRYTDNAGNAHVVNTAYRGDKTYSDTIVLGTDDFDGNLNLGVSVPAALGKRHRDNEVIYELVDTGAAYESLFYLNDNNELIFTGNTRDAALLGSRVELQLEVRVPDDTTEVLTHTIVVDVTGTATFELARSTHPGLTHFFEVTELSPDPDGAVATHSYFSGTRVEVYSYKWYFEEVGQNAVVLHEDGYSQQRGGRYYIPAGDDYPTTEWHSARLAEGARFFVEITYTDGDDNVEMVTVTTSRVSFAEDAQFDTAAEGDWGVADALATASASTTNPNGALRYSLSKNPDDLFTINAETGAISFASDTTLDYEDSNQQKRYQLEVTATDTALSAGNTATQTIVIDIVNADDGDAVYAVRGVIADGEVLRAVLETPDPDGGMTNIQYQWLVDGVEIADATGETYTIEDADFYGEYQLRISYDDAESQEGDDPREVIAIVKTLIFDERADNYAPLIAENREGALFTVQATYGGAADDVVYALINADTALFEIDASSGTISLVSGATLDYATATEHSLTVEATYTDDTGRTFTKLADVVIDVGELVNEDAPTLTATTDAGRTRDDRPAPAEGTDTGIRLNVADADIDEANRHEIIITGTEADKFELKEINGVLGIFLKAEQSIDYDSLSADEQANGITLTITITDTLDDGTKATDDVDVTIVEYNSLSWDADAGTQRLWVIEGAKSAGAAVASVAASSAEAGGVSYAFADGTLTSGIFSINAETGAITYTADTHLDDARTHQHVLDVVASHETNGDVIEAQITIDVQNEGINVYGTTQELGSAVFTVRGRPNTEYTINDDFYAYEIAAGVAVPDPDGVNADGYTYTWYRHDPGVADPVVVQEDFWDTNAHYTGPAYLVKAKNYQKISYNDLGRMEAGSYFSVDVSYTDNAGNDHVLNILYPESKTHVDTLVLGAHDLDGNLNLGNALPTITNKRDRASEVEYELVDTGAAYESLFQLNDAGELIFTGNTRDAALLGDGVELQLEVRVPEESAEVFSHTIVVDVTGQVEHASFAVERYNLDRHHIWGVKILQDDPDGAFNNDEYITGNSASATIQWGFFYPDDYRYGKAGEVEATPRRYVLGRDQIEALDDGAYVTATITYTDNAGNRHVVETAQTADFEIENFASPGATLRVAQVRKDDYGVASVTYRWFEQDPDGANRKYIGDTSSNTYTLDNMDVTKVYGVVVEYTSNNHGASFTLDKGSAIERIANSVVFDAAAYTDTSSHDSADEDFSGFDPTPYFGDASNDDMNYQFAPGSTTDNGNTLRIKAGSGNTILQEVKDGVAFDLLRINADTGDISYAGDTYLDATDFKNTPRLFKTYNINVRGIYDADGDGVDADDPFADVPYVISVSGERPPHALFDLALTTDKHSNVRLVLTELFADPDGVNGRYVYTWTEYEKGKDPYKFSYDINEPIYAGNIKTGDRIYQAGPTTPLVASDVAKLANGASYEVKVTYTDNAGNSHEVITSTTAGYAIEGYASPGATLRAYEISPDIYGTDTDVDITYRWFEQDPDGANRQYIHVGTSDTYTLTTTTADKVYGVVVEYTDNNGVTYTAADGNAPESITDSVVFDKDVYVEPIPGLHGFHGYAFDFGETAPSIFTTDPYFGDVSNDNIHYEFAPGSSATNGYSISIKAGSNNAILQETKGSTTIDIVTIDSATGDISLATGGFLDAGRDAFDDSDKSITYNFKVRGIYDVDGDGIDADDPYADVTLQVEVKGKDIRLGGEAQIPDRQEPTAHDPAPTPSPAHIPDRRTPQAEVIIPDTDDPAPAFVQATYSATVTRGAEIGSVITTITATNAETYSLAGGNGLFEINDDGDITLAVPNTRTDAGAHTLTVIATDTAGSVALARVIITDYAIRGTDGADWGEVEEFGEVRTLFGTDDADSIYGYGARDLLRGKDGDDTLHGGDGNDILWGGNDDDTAFGGDGNDYLYGEGGNDNLHGGNNDDTLSGGNDQDTLNGDGGDDILYGDNGADILHGGAGKDYLYGGKGADVFVLGKDDDIVRDFNPANGDRIRINDFNGEMPQNVNALLTAANLRVVKTHINVQGFDSWSDSANTMNTAIYRGNALVMVLEDFDADLTLDMFDLPASLGITASTAIIDTGTILTASITHDDPQGYQDGETPTGWVWFYKSKPETDIGTGSARYVVKEADAGEQIGVRLTYTDAEGRIDTAETHLTEAVQRVVIKPEPEFANKDGIFTAEADKATNIEAGKGADKVQDGNRNDVINGGKGDDDIDLTASKEDNDVVIYGIGNQMASGGSDNVKGFVRGRDKFVFQIKQSDIDTSGMTLRPEDGYEGLVNYITQGTEDLIDDQFWTNLNFDVNADNVIELAGVSFHFKDSTFFSGGRVSMPIVSIKFADAVSIDELRTIFSTSDTPIVNKQGVIVDLDYLDDFLGGDDSVGFEII